MAKEKLTEYFQPQTNRRYEVYRFRQTKQNQEESLDQFHTRLRTLVQNCEFAEDNLEFEIEQQILVGGTSSIIRKRASRDPKYTLKDMLLGTGDVTKSAHISRGKLNQPGILVHKHTKCDLVKRTITSIPSLAEIVVVHFHTKTFLFPRNGV